MKNEVKEIAPVNQKRSLIWPFLLMMVGVLLLLNNMGVIPWSVWADLIALWPLLLVFAGLEIMSESSGIAKFAVRVLEIFVLGYVVLYVVSSYHMGLNSFLKKWLKWWPNEKRLYQQRPYFRWRELIE